VSEPTRPPPGRRQPPPQPSEDGLDPPCATCRPLPVGSGRAHRAPLIVRCWLGRAYRAPPVRLSPLTEVSPPPFDHRRGLTSMADLVIVSWVFLVLSQLRIDIVAMQPYFTVATYLIWSVTILSMHHSSDGHPRRQRPVKSVARGERCHHYCPLLLCLVVAMGNANVIFSSSLLSNRVVMANADITMPVATVPLYIRSWTQYPLLLLPQTTHSESRLFVRTVAKKIEKGGGSFDFIF
jgi:hypothetical protein